MALVYHLKCRPLSRDDVYGDVPATIWSSQGGYVGAYLMEDDTYQKAARRFHRSSGMRSFLREQITPFLLRYVDGETSLSLRVSPSLSSALYIFSCQNLSVIFARLLSSKPRHWRIRRIARYRRQITRAISGRGAACPLSSRVNHCVFAKRSR